jgi:hypothetical protein
MDARDRTGPVRASAEDGQVFRFAAPSASRTPSRTSAAISPGTGRTCSSI